MFAWGSEVRGNDTKSLDGDRSWFVARVLSVTIFRGNWGEELNCVSANRPMNFGAERLGIAKKDLASRYDKRVTDVWGGTVNVPWGRSE